MHAAPLHAVANAFARRAAHNAGLRARWRRVLRRAAAWQQRALLCVVAALSLLLSVAWYHNPAVVYDWFLRRPSPGAASASSDDGIAAVTHHHALPTPTPPPLAAPSYGPPPRAAFYDPPPRPASDAEARERYVRAHGGRQPPPLFGAWYQYAAANGCRLDDAFYDPIDRDMGLFVSHRAQRNAARAAHNKSTTPYAITHDMLARAAALSRTAVVRIRNGKVKGSTQHADAWRAALKPVAVALQQLCNAARQQQKQHLKQQHQQQRVAASAVTSDDDDREDVGLVACGGLDIVLNGLDEPRVLRPAAAAAAPPAATPAAAPAAAAVPAPSASVARANASKSTAAAATAAAASAAATSPAAYAAAVMAAALSRNNNATLSRGRSRSGRPPPRRGVPAGAKPRRASGYRLDAARRVAAARARSLLRRQYAGASTRAVAAQLAPHCTPAWNVSADEDDRRRQRETGHGFFLGPSTLDVTDALVPVWSQTKVPSCFADIIIPSKYTLNGVWRLPDDGRRAVTATANATASANASSATTAADAISDPLFATRIDAPYLDALNARHPWHSKRAAVYWRGSATGGVGYRSGECHGMHRQRLVRVLQQWQANGTAETDACFVAGGEAKAGTHSECTRLSAFGGACARAPFARHWQYKYLIDIDGNSFSRRFKALLYSNSLLFKVTAFPEYFEQPHGLQPWRHYVPVRLDLSDLNAAVQWARAHDRDAQRIARAATDFAARQLRAADERCWLLRAAMEYAPLLAPDAWTLADSGSGSSTVSNSGGSGGLKPQPRTSAVPVTRARPTAPPPSASARRTGTERHALANATHTRAVDRTRRP